MSQSGRTFRERSEKFRRAYRPADAFALSQRNAQAGMARLVVATRDEQFGFKTAAQHLP